MTSNRLLMLSCLLVACGDATHNSSSGVGSNSSERASGSMEAERTVEAEPTGSAGSAESTAPVSPATVIPPSEHPAINAVVFGDRVVIEEVTPEGGPMRLTARDLFDDRVLWTVERPGDPHRGWIQLFDPSHVLISVGGKLERIAVADGRVVSTHDYRGGGRYLWRQHDVCLLNEACTVDLIDCETARPLQTFAIGRSHRRPLRGSFMDRDGPTCLGGPDIIGRSGDTLVLDMSNWETDRVPSNNRMRSGADTWVGVHATTGAIQWHHEHPSSLSTGAHGRYAWFKTSEGVTVLRGDTGRVVRRIARDDVRLVFDLEREPPAIQLLSSSKLEVIELATGRQVHERTIPNGALAVLSDARFPDNASSMFRSSDEPQTFLWFDAGSEHRETIPAGSTLQRGPVAGRWRVGRQPTYDTAGNEIAPGQFEVERFHLPAGERGRPNRARLKRGDEVLRTFDHDAWSLGEATRTGVTAVVVFVTGDDWRTDAKVQIHRQ